MPRPRVATRAEAGAELGGCSGDDVSRTGARAALLRMRALLGYQTARLASGVAAAATNAEAAAMFSEDRAAFDKKCAELTAAHAK